MRFKGPPNVFDEVCMSLIATFRFCLPGLYRSLTLANSASMPTCALILCPACPQIDGHPDADKPIKDSVLTEDEFTAFFEEQDKKLPESLTPFPLYSPYAHQAFALVPI